MRKRKSEQFKTCLDAPERYTAQSHILDFAESEDLELADALARFGAGYDDFVYADSGSRRWEGQSPLYLSDLVSSPHGIPFVSFFSGCGGMDLGFETAGFEHAAAFEINELFCKTLRINRPKWTVFGPPTDAGDVSDLEQVTDHLTALIDYPFDGVFIGGPPCQPFSIAANQRFSKSGDKYKRIGFEHDSIGCLLFDYVALVERFLPSCFVIENVLGLRDLDGGKQVAYVIDRLAERGYTVHEPKVVNAAHFGVPQIRERLFIVGARNGASFQFPIESDTSVGCGAVLCAPPPPDANHETRAHKVSSMRRYRDLNYGQRDHLGRVDRLDPAVPSKTVIAGGTRGGGRSHLHPEIPRTLTVRECARLQTFPDDFVFIGSTARQFTQVGNAVPPVLAAQIAAAVAASVFDVGK